jgi:predicted O-linked N-acetylglucosamine transferase (SPINDLY family)
MNELGIEKNRLIIEKDSNRNELLNNYNKIDIALDTFPYNGGTTTLEAYSMCVPVLTLVGQNFISRCGYSINSNLGLNDWSCFTYDEYIEKGISFAKNIKLLEKVRKYLIENRKKTPVFNSELFTKDFTDTIKTVLN